MNKCDLCGAKGPKVILADSCPECGRLVGFPVPGRNEAAAEVQAYDVGETDEDLRDMVSRVAQRNFETLLRRKRSAERAAGFAPSPRPVDPDEAADPDFTGNQGGGGADSVQGTAE